MISPTQEPEETDRRGAPPQPLKRRTVYRPTTSQLAPQTRALIAPSPGVERPSSRLRSAGPSTPPLCSAQLGQGINEASSVALARDITLGVPVSNPPTVIAVNIEWLAEYCGTSVAMIEKHYGRYIKSDSREQLAARGKSRARSSRSRW